MKYISEEEFLEQPKEIKDVFVKWWEGNKDNYDLCSVKRFYELPRLWINIENSYYFKYIWKVTCEVAKNEVDNG